MSKISYRNGIAVKLTVSWCIDDVLHQAKELGYNMTRKEAGEVLELVENNYDCMYGITWDSLISAIEEVKNG